MSKHSRLWKVFKTLTVILLLAGLTLSSVALSGVYAQDDNSSEDETSTEEVVESAEMSFVTTEQFAEFVANLDTVWMLIAAFLVFWMQAGFALVEAGFVRARNVVNILMKNLFDFAIGSIAYWAIGFAIMFTGGKEWFFLSGIPDVYPGLNVPTLAFFFFQLVFAATAATIVSGAVAERMEFKGYFIYSIAITAVIYPIVGHWIWGGGWLSTLDTPFHDFAGSTVVHSTGAYVGLIGAIFLGARKGRFGKNALAIPGHNMTLATLGVFILWMGWFGFNPGSQLNSDGASIALITVNTNIAAAAGAITAMLIGWYFSGVAQLPWGLNGALGGLVAITAPCAVVTPGESIVIGVIGALIMYGIVNLLETFKIDDPVGAVGVHGGAGIWGTLAVGLFADSGSVVGIFHGGGIDQLVTQIIGIVAVGVFVIICAIIIFTAIKALGLLRVNEQAEMLGLDIYEHGTVAYPEFTNSPSAPVENS